ncbi:carbon-nitrogen hydrolase family protein [Collimonas antrihumi]|uniref:carbon-nitrogen hydrolase family protein n=1 Tax=Collimonas antrihumi TaxID=1940615 RepID=UPI001B8C0721|nr:carbon-nitrogen hydrolase family protein [Collimonas antrihumi]
MTTLTIAAAQSISIAGDVKANVSRHLRFMEQAADHGVQLLVFPELSLTGYERGLGRELAMRPDAEILMPLHDLAQRMGMTAVVGAPMFANDSNDVFIGALIIGNANGVGLYTKQHLHPGEEVVFTAGSRGVTVPVADMTVALAICADIVQLAHAAQAKQLKANVYAAGVLITKKAYSTETELLRTYATEHNMAVLMANHGGPTGGWSPIGQSAFWAEGGRLIVAAPGEGNLLVIATRDASQWSGKIVSVTA